jgi:hypothetical protein
VKCVGSSELKYLHTRCFICHNLICEIFFCTSQLMHKHCHISGGKDLWPMSGAHIICICILYSMSRGSAVIIANGYGLDDWGMGVPVGSRIFTRFKFHPTCYPVGSRSSFLFTDPAKLIMQTLDVCRFSCVRKECCSR